MSDTDKYDKAFLEAEWRPVGKQNKMRTILAEIKY